MSAKNRGLIATLLAGLLASTFVVGLASVSKPAPGEVVIARVEGIPIYAAEFEVGLLFWEVPRLRHLDAPVVERHGEEVATLANLVIERTARVAWERLLAPGHLVIDTDFGTMTPEELEADRRAVLSGNVATSEFSQRIRAELEAVGEDAYWGIVIPNQAVDGHARLAFTQMRGFEGHYGTIELVKFALTLDIDVGRSFSGRVSEADLRAYLEDFLEVMPAVIDELYEGRR
jgi:hypothetical protein